MVELKRPCPACRRVGPHTRTSVMVKPHGRTDVPLEPRVGFRCELCKKTLLVKPEQADDPETLRRIWRYVGS